MSTINEATRRQMDAAHPGTSTWLAANAGSGKTRVLTDRVARLLLEGVQPQHILCLTYTKAAASEMQNRLFKRLGDWAMLPDDKLRAELTDLGVERTADARQLTDARTLFARAIETPGGLKIQTIHSFCAALLRRFPLEAKVSPQFSEIEDRAADMLRAEIVDEMAGGAKAHLVANLTKQYTGEDFLRLTQEIVGQRGAFSHPLSWAECLALFDQPADASSDKIMSNAFAGGELQLVNELIPHLIAKGGNDAKAGEKLKLIHALDLSALPLLEAVFLTGAKAKDPFSAKLGSFPTKATQDVVAHLMPQLEAFMLRIEDVRESRLALMSAHRTQVLHAFASAFIGHYERAKLVRGWLDFDDLILKARQLLNDDKVAAWVLFRIDGGIDHILVDEAQDTSPDQWDVVRRLAEEFSSGEGARADTLRTLFVVGDKKQSIYSFQGADPREFDRMQAEFKAKFDDAGASFQETTLDYSFRSSAAILRLVDQTFDNRIQAGFAKDSQHVAFKSDLPGRVDLWPVVEKVEDEDERVWYDPVDRRSSKHHSVVLADQIAKSIQTLIKDKHAIPVDGDTNGTFNKRPIRAGDFLILVQRRSALFSEVIRACKAHDLPIAGADRLKVGAELAVRDLGALLSFLATPDDSLSLATALKSPLFGWSEQQLFDTAHRRTQEHLWPNIRSRPDDFPDTFPMLRDLRDNVDFLRPFDLIERILTRHDGRRKLLGRLGTEAQDGIDALLSQALAYERTAVPSLTGFLVWMKTDDLDIKRQIDSASDQIRVMTVHGAKGLEAPIVILPDTGKRDNPVRGDMIKIGDVPVWKAKEADTPARMKTAIEDKKESQLNERMRLLYVALTRAEKWLIVAGAGDMGKTSEDSWYNTIQAAMVHSNATDTPFPVVGQVKRLTHADWDAPTLVSAKSVQKQTADLNPLFTRAAPPPVAKQQTLSPSKMEGTKALPGPAALDEDTAKAYGTLVHWHLEHPNAQAPASSALPDALVAQATAEARATLNAANLAHVFARDTLAEVSITAPLGTHRLHGTIDRLIITPTTITAIDFKSNAVVPTNPNLCPNGILRQMGAYLIALQAVYSDHKIETGIVWTKEQSLMMLPHDLVFDALKSSPYLDV
ncbi:MAG: double-strand break repair helicase AddA [Ascidiaceihabitans sp.]|nr:double-strand break repair helicase AddA [Ascidiaceihabitans sp.]